MIVKGQTTGKQENDILTDPVRCLNNPPARLEPLTFKIEVRHATHYATGILLSINFASESLPLIWLQMAGFSMVYREEGLCEKATFQLFFAH